MEVKQKEDLVETNRTGPTEKPRSKNGRTDGAGTQGEAIFTYLSKSLDIAGLMREYPQLTEDDLRTYFVQARSLLREASTISFKKGVSRTVVVRTHGLPAPDLSIHKGGIFRELIALLKPGKLLDLGAGKGNFSITAAELGWQVTAVDARTVRWPGADSEKDPIRADLIRTIRWVQSDVREFAIGEREYDLVCILGLLHHLEVSDQVSLLKRCSTMPTLLDTRIAKASLDVEGVYEGMLIREHGETSEERDAVPQASWGNPLSFQHTEESLLRLVLDCGFTKMMQMRPPHRSDYTFYLCLPSRGKTEDRLERRRKRRANKNKLSVGEESGRGRAQVGGLS